MANLPLKMPRKALFVHSICLLSLIPIIEGADPTFSYVECPNTTITRGPENLLANINILPSLLSPNSKVSDGFYKFTVGGRPPDVAFNSSNSTVSNGIYRFTANGNSTVHNTIYGLALCRGDLSAAACQDCVVYAARDVVQQCPGSTRVAIWYDECMLRYSNDSIFAAQETSEWVVLINPQNVTNATHYSEVMAEVMNNIAARASSGDSHKKFATGEANFSSVQLVYGLAQCTSDLSNFDCDSCLRNSISKFLYQYRGARVYFPNCFVRGELYPFYNVSVGAAPPPRPSPVLPPPPPTTNSTRSPGKTFFRKAWIWDIILKF